MRETREGTGNERGGAAGADPGGDCCAALHQESLLLRSLME